MKGNTKSMVLAALFCALTAVAAQMIIPLAPVPLSFAMAAIYLTGAILDKKTALFAQLAYLLLGAAGAPVFSGFSGGLAKLAGPTGGYLAVYPAMAFLIAFLAEKWGRSFWKYCVSMGLALILCYAVGTLWLMVLTHGTLMNSLMAAVIPFIPMDIVKIIGSASLAAGLNTALAKAHLTASA